VVPGTLSFETARWNHPRSGQILVSANWTDEANAAGFRGTTTQGGVAGHGTSSPFDIHNTLIAAGPDFRERATSEVPTGNVDIAPTLLHLLGVPAPPTMAGRIIHESFRNGPSAASIRVEQMSETARTPDGTYELTARFSIAAGHRYLDWTAVRRAPAR
jgi:arylsulfatase A-like enzyme